MEYLDKIENSLTKKCVLTIFMCIVINNNKLSASFITTNISTINL